MRYVETRRVLRAYKYVIDVDVRPHSFITNSAKHNKYTLYTKKYCLKNEPVFA